MCEAVMTSGNENPELCSAHLLSRLSAELRER